MAEYFVANEKVVGSNPTIRSRRKDLEYLGPAVMICMFVMFLILGMTDEDIPEWKRKHMEEQRAKMEEQRKNK